MATLVVKRESENAQLPVRGSPFSAGLDLFSAEGVVIEPGKRALVSTGLSMALPPNTYGRVAPRSGLAVRHGIDVGAGVIDVDYRGIVHVLLFNHGDAPFVVNRGDRIAQLIVESIVMANPEEATSLPAPEGAPASALVEARGTRGFGSTGI